MGHVKGPLCGKKQTCKCGLEFVCKRKQGHEPSLCTIRTKTRCPKDTYGLHIAKFVKQDDMMTRIHVLQEVDEFLEKVLAEQKKRVDDLEDVQEQIKGNVAIPLTAADVAELGDSLRSARVASVTTSQTLARFRKDLRSVA